MNTGLAGKVAIVAGSSQGIGRAVAVAFAAEGARLALCARTRETLSHFAGELKQRKAEVLTDAVDVSKADQVSEFVDSVAKHYGRVDICVVNAGGPPPKGFLATTAEEWQRAFDTNLMSAVSFAHAVIPHMQRNRWGRFLVITSVTVKQPFPNLVLSNSIRAGVVGLLKSLSLEFGKHGILFNNVAPGLTATDRLKELADVQAKSSNTSPDAIFDEWSASSDLHRIGTPEEIADAVVWLASERASFVTGQTLLADGGYYRGL